VFVKETRLLLSEAIAFALNHEGVTAMEQAVEDRGGEDVVAKDGTPLCNDLVGGDQEPVSVRYRSRRHELRTESSRLDNAAVQAVLKEVLGHRCIAMRPKDTHLRPHEIPAHEHLSDAVIADSVTASHARER